MSSRLPGTLLVLAGATLVIVTACQSPAPNNVPGSTPDLTAPSGKTDGKAVKHYAVEAASQPAYRNGNAFLRGRPSQDPIPAPTSPAARQLLDLGDFFVSTLAGPFVPDCDARGRCSMPSGFADGLAPDARFFRPWGLGVDKDGNVYVADGGNNRIRLITPQGGTLTLAGGSAGFADGVGTNAQFNYPQGVAVGKDGYVYVADANNNRIRQISPAGMVTTLAGGDTAGYVDGPGALARFNGPNGVVADALGNVFVADTGNQRVRKIAPDGTVTTVAGSGDYGFADGAGAVARFKDLYDLAIDKAGNLYVADYSNFRVRKVAPDGTVSTLAGSGEYGFADGPAATAKFTWMAGVTVDDCGNVYVADESNLRIRKIAGGQVTSIAGDGTFGYADGIGTAAQFAWAEGVEIDKNGNLYISEYSGHRIRKMNVGACSSDAGLSGEDSNAFSPNGDGTKDTYGLEVVATGDWTLEVDGHPGAINTGPGPNQGNKSFPWDGKVNGITLPDGKYILRLKAGGQEKTAEVIIDTKAPSVANIKVEPGPNGTDVRISAEIKDSTPETQGSGVSTESIAINSNSSKISLGIKTYSSETNVFSQTLSEDNISTLDLPYVEDSNNIEVVAEDLAGNKTTNKQELLSDTDIKSRVKKDGRELFAAITVGKTTFRPLLEEVNSITVTPRVPGNALGHAIISFYSVTIYKPSPNPNKEWVLWNGMVFPPYTSRTINWDGKNQSTGQPLPEGDYTVTGRHIGFQKMDEYKIRIDNRRIFNWRDGNNAGDADQRVHILWGSTDSRKAGLFHNWHFFAPVRALNNSNWPTSANPTQSEKDRSFVSSIYSNHLLTPIRFTVNPAFQVRAEKKDGGVNIRYESNLSDAKGIQHMITARTRRYLDIKRDIIVERVEDAYVD